MAMTAISKGFRTIMKSLSEYCNRQENNMKLNTTTAWLNEYETPKTDQQNRDELLGEQLIRTLLNIPKIIILACIILFILGMYRLSFGKTFETIVIGKILAAFR